MVVTGLAEAPTAGIAPAASEALGPLSDPGLPAPDQAGSGSGLASMDHAVYAMRDRLAEGAGQTREQQAELIERPQRERPRGPTSE